jgi:MFS family permease
MSLKPNPLFLWQRLKRGAAVVTAGGSWSVQLPDLVQRNLRWYFLDGVFSSSQEAINITYLTLFVLALGATKAQIGLMTSLASLSAVVLLLPGAILAERFGKRKWVVVLSGGGVTRLAILGMALLPFITTGPKAVAIAIVFKLLMDGFSNLGIPAWTSLTADIVPLAWRGRFFGSRNMVVGIATMFVTLLAGQIITMAVSPLIGFQTVYGMAFLFGSAATFCYAHIHEEPKAPNREAMTAYKPASLVDPDAVELLPQYRGTLFLRLSGGSAPGHPGNRRRA